MHFVFFKLGNDSRQMSAMFCHYDVQENVSNESTLTDFC